MTPPSEMQPSEMQSAETRPPGVRPAKRESKGGKVVVLMLLGLCLLFGLAYGVLFLRTGDRVPEGTSVAGVDVGGLTAAAAERKLRASLGQLADQPITAVVKGKTERIEPDEAGLAVDYGASIAKAGGVRSASPARLWAYYTGGEDVDPVLDIDDSKLERTINRLGKLVDVPTQEGTIRFHEGDATPVLSKPGVTLSPDGTRILLKQAFLAKERRVSLPVEDAEPYISDKAVHTAMDEFANPAMSAPVTLVLDKHDVVVPTKVFSDAISMLPNGGRLVPVVDAAVLLDRVETMLPAVGDEPRDATVRLVDGKPRVVPGKVGVTFDKEAIENDFLDYVVKPTGQRRMVVAGSSKKPDFTTADAKALKIVEKVSSFTTHFPYAEYRNVNLTRAAQKINNTVLKPGETFSLNDVVGERTRANGFTEGYIISDGIFKQDLGGGVSQIATTTFNAAFFAGLEDVEHKPHSVYIDRYPIGREATVAWGAVDLRFKNTTPYGVLVTAHVDKSSPSHQGAATVTMYSTKYWDITTKTGPRYAATSPKTRHLTSAKCEPATGYGGFSIDIWRYFHHHGRSAVARTEEMHTVYNPSDTVVCGKPKKRQ